MTHRRKRHIKKRKEKRIAEIVKNLEKAETVESCASHCVKKALSIPFENKSNSYYFSETGLETLKDIDEIIREDTTLAVSQYNCENKINSSDKRKCSIAELLNEAPVSKGVNVSDGLEELLNADPSEFYRSSLCDLPEAAYHNEILRYLNVDSKP